MKLEGKILKFKKKGDNYIILNKGAGYEVGAIVQHISWGSWVFKPHASNVYSPDMLADIKSFMEQLK